MVRLAIWHLALSCTSGHLLANARPSETIAQRERLDDLQAVDILDFGRLTLREVRLMSDERAARPASLRCDP